MIEHTPGKWTACLLPGPNHGHVLADDWSVIAICPCNVGPIGTGEANARLIAAAPRLLEAAIAMSDASTLAPRPDSRWGKALLELRAAIAAAKGKSR